MPQKGERRVTSPASRVTAAVADPGYAWGDHLGSVADGDVGLDGFPNAPMHAIPMWAHREPVPSVAPALNVVFEHWQQAGPPTSLVGTPMNVAAVDLGVDGASEITRSAVARSAISPATVRMSLSLEGSIDREVATTR